MFPFTRGPQSAFRPSKAACALFCFAGMVSFAHGPAHAQASASIAVQNDDRFRGRSMSNGEPVAIATLVYDLENGVSLGGAAAATTNGPAVGWLRGSANISYAKSLGGGWAADGGMVVQTYSDRYSSGQPQTFVEVFGGATYRQFAFHASYSPSYLDSGIETLYLEVNAVHEFSETFRAHGHAGLLNRLSGQGSLGGENARWDAQIGMTKDLDHLSFFVTASTGGSSEGTYFGGPWRGQNALVAGISRSF